jgi:DNA polymerase-1
VDASPLLVAARLPLLCGVRAGQYRDFAALRGDVSDNLPGVVGIGAKTAARLLAGFDRVADAYAAIDGGREHEVVALIGPAATRRLADPTSRANVRRNLRLMAMREDLPLPRLDEMRVPMDVVRLQSALRSRDIRLGASLWALTGAAAPGEDGWARVAEQEDLPGSAAPPAVPAGPTPVPVVEVARAEDDQLSLF